MSEGGKGQVGADVRAFLGLALAPLVGRDDVAVLVQATDLVEGEAWAEALRAAEGVKRVDLVQSLHGADRSGWPGGGWLALVVDLVAAEPALDGPGLAALLGQAEAALRAGGVLLVRVAARHAELLQQLSARFQHVAEIAVPSEAPDRALDYAYRARRTPPPLPPSAN